MKLTAKFIHLLTPQTGSSSNGKWIKQDFVVETKDTYPKKVVISSWNNQFDLTKLNNESYFDFKISLDSKVYNGNYYSSASLIEQPKPTTSLALMIDKSSTINCDAKIKTILPETHGTGWTKQELIFEPFEHITKTLSGVILNKKVDLSNFSEGDNVKISFFIESKEYNQKWYTNFKIWKIETIQNIQSNQSENYDLSDPDSWPF